MTDNLPAHSKLGASSAERWMNCPGSVALLKNLKLPETDEPDYRAEGTCAHEVAADCLKTDGDAWEYQHSFTKVGVPDDELVGHTEAVQVYLDKMRPLLKGKILFGVEERFHRPEVHKDFFGTIDLWFIDHEESLLDVTDYKHGIGIVVEVEGNPQIMYYAYSKLLTHPGVRRVRMRIVQPRGFHPAGPIREWEISAEDLCEWAERELVPAMIRAEIDKELDAGDWCRFCPAKLVCPLLTGLFGAAMKADLEHIVNIGNEALGRGYQHVKGVKFYIKALEEEVHRRLTAGDDVEGTKLVAQRANRVYKSGAEVVLKARLGDAAYTEPELKSPAEIEKLGSDAKELIKEWAYTPLTGTAVALTSDKRPAIRVRTAAEAFGPAIAKLHEEATNG